MNKENLQLLITEIEKGEPFNMGAIETCLTGFIRRITDKYNGGSRQIKDFLDMNAQEARYLYYGEDKEGNKLVKVLFGDNKNNEQQRRKIIKYLYEILSNSNNTER